MNDILIEEIERKENEIRCNYYNENFILEVKQKEIQEALQNLHSEYKEQMKRLEIEKINLCEFKVGDFVRVTWVSDDFGVEKEDGFIYFIGIRHDGYNGFMFYFNRKNKDGTKSHYGINIPKYSKIVKIDKL